MAKRGSHVSKLTTEKTEFRREIGVFGGVSIIGGIMIGSGIFYLGSYVLERVGMNSGLALLCWLLGGIISLFGGLCYAELGAAMPKSGGRLVYLDEAFHPVVGFMAGFTDLVIGGPGSIAAVATALIAVLQPYTGLSDFGVKAGAIVLIIIITAYNLGGVKLASVVQNISMVAKLIPIALIMLVALFIGRVSPDLSLGSAAAYAADNNTNIFSMVAFGVVAALWAYEGWTNLNTVAEEIKEPKKKLPLALIIGIGSVTVIYVLFNFAIMRVLPHEEIVSMINSGDLYLGTAVAKKVFGSAGAFVVSLGMILSMFGSANGMVLAQPRMYYAMAEEGHFFKAYAKLHPKTRVPHVAIIVQGILSIILVLIRNLSQLTDMVVMSAMVFNALVIIAVPILRKKYPKIERPYKVWFYPVSVIVTALIFIALIINTAMEDFVLGLVGLGVPVLGAVVYYIFDLKLKKEKRNGNE
ncbi:MAG TPA: amino acid permease [Lachnospiraceae bacterium]|jgi:APA family basic amino acid/polyamine antiporter|nr:amino acid permease [Lachnospiraceae bacterium]